MANLVRNFIKGRMNKSVDERLVPNGEYIDAQNIRMGSTEDSEIGAVENTKGNEQLTTLVYPPTGDALSGQATCIGSYADGAEETIYWFVHDPNFTAVGATGKLDMIVSYNTRTGTLVNHVVSIDDPTDPTNTRTTLNFDPQYLITGVDLVDDLLFFTDDFNPPRRINVTKAYPQPSAPTHTDNAFLSDDILVIKACPDEAPVIVPFNNGDQNNYMEERFICFAYRYQYEESEYSATSEFTTPSFVAKPFLFTPESFTNEGMENATNACSVTVRTGTSLVKGIDILFKEMDDSIIRVIRKIDKEENGLLDNSTYTITFTNSEIFTILPESEILRLYDNVPRLAKAQTMMGNRLVYGNYVEGYDLLDDNGQPAQINYGVTHLRRQAGLTAMSLTVSNSTTYNFPPSPSIPFTTVKVDFIDFNFSTGDSISIELAMEHDGVPPAGWLTVSGFAPTSVTPATTIFLSYTLTEDFESVSDMVASASFLAAVGTAGTIETNPADYATSDQTIWTNAWNAIFPLQQTGGIPDPQDLESTGVNAADEPAQIVASDETSFTIAFPMPKYSSGATESYEAMEITRASGTYISQGSQYSLHSNRSYEIGMVFMDEYGRASTPYTSDRNKVHIPCSDSIFRNVLRVQIPTLMRPPYWADRYKFVIKPDREGYETIYCNIFETHDGYTYFLLEGEQAAKVEKGDRYVVKVDCDGPTDKCTYATVLEKKALAVGDIATGPPAIPAIAGTYMKIKAEFDVTPQAGANEDLGEKTASSNNSGETDTTGEYPLLVYTGFDGTAANRAIPVGSRITLTMNFERLGRGEGSSCEQRTLIFDRTFLVDDNYTDIVDWFYNQDGVEEAIENTIGLAGDPLPENTVLGETSSSAADYGMTGSTTNNQIRWYKDTAGAIWDMRFVVIGARECTGFIGGGDSPNRRSRVSVRWNIVRASDIVVFETQPTDALPNLWYESSQSFPIINVLGNRRYRGNVQDQTGSQPAIIDTAFFNCISYGNGVESYKIRDSISGKPISLGNRVTTVSEQDYKEIRRFADLTYSGVYNDETNVNKLNEFNLGLLNFKPLDDRYGPVEKLFGRRTDILTLQEDKISYVLAGKNLLTDATGESVVASVPEVLGTQVARVEDYGISNNPESFAEWGPHKFFTDAKRGAVIHLFGDGQNEQLEVISENGMRSWFRDMFIGDFNTQKLGGYDPYMDEYVLASNEVLLPGETDCIECNTVQSFLLTSAGESYCVDLGNQVGNATVSYNVIEATGADSAVITASYNGTDTDSGSIGNGSSGSFTINKDEVDVAEANISIAFTGTERFVVQVIVKCPEVVELTVVLATLSQPDAQRQTIHSEYQWSDGSFVSPLTSKPVEFAYGAVEPIVSQWEEFTAAQGSGLVPTDGSDITMIYNRIFPDNYTIRPEDRFHLLRTDTRYTESQITDIINDGDLITVTPSGAQPEYTGDFTMPATGQYLYLVWNYTDVAPVGTSLLLDDYPGATAAYSVRKLSSTYSGSALRVRRTVAPFDEQDIGFQSNGDLDTAAISAFGGSDPLTVSAWYDQSGSANNATQATAANQAQIYNGASVITENGKPALDFAGVGVYPVGNVVTDDVTVVGVVKSTASAIEAIMSVQEFYNQGYELIYINPNTMRWAVTTADLDITFPSATQSLLFASYDGSSQELALDGTNTTNSTTQSLSLTYDLSIGTRRAGLIQQPWGGVMQEIVVYANDTYANTTDRNGIESNINTYFSIY